MLRAMDLAILFVETYNGLPEENITNLTLNKLMYFAQGHSLAGNGCPPFDDDNEAWDYGTVLLEEYDDTE